MKINQPKHSRIILTIARKDILQAIKDRITLGVIIGVLLLILPSQLIPLILRSETNPLAVIYFTKNTSPGNELIDNLASTAVQAQSVKDLQDEIASGRSQIIGLVIPGDFFENLSAKEVIEIDSYFPHWTKPDEANDLIKHFEEQIQRNTGINVKISIKDDQVHPTEKTRGSEVMFILQLVNAVLTISLALVPQLIFTEKESHTLDALLISPARLSDLVIGKGLVGAFYASIAATMVILLNTSIISHWWLLISSIVSGIAFAVLLGLSIGLIFDNFQNATFAMYIIVILAIAPAFINLFLNLNIPHWLSILMNWLPSGSFAHLLLTSVLKTYDPIFVLLLFCSIWVSNLLLFGVNIWLIKNKTS